MSSIGGSLGDFPEVSESSRLLIKRTMKLDRRRLLKGAGVSFASLAAAGVGLSTTMGGAVATGGTNFGNTSLTSNDGTVEYVAIYGDSVVNWDGFDRAATQARIVTGASARKKNQSSGSLISRQNLNDTGRFDLSQGDSWGGAGETISTSDGGREGSIKTDVGYGAGGNKNEEVYWEIVGDGDGDTLNDYGLPQQSLPAAPFEVDSDGSSQDYRITIYTTYEWYDSSDDLIFDKEFTSQVKLTVNNEATSVTGSSGPDDDGAVSG